MLQTRRSTYQIPPGHTVANPCFNCEELGTADVCDGRRLGCAGPRFSNIRSYDQILNENLSLRVELKRLKRSMTIMQNALASRAATPSSESSNDSRDSDRLRNARGNYYEDIALRALRAGQSLGFDPLAAADDMDSSDDLTSLSHKLPADSQ
ncbi:hypothetical protein HGRIS_005323 [Hohenbuehelia grisea]|uniref:Uncharacterized protein n=1 Tax=Hohenbuehelia grisea TaxID=104357 RepID=A0ABR3JFE8_9AGAR